MIEKTINFKGIKVKRLSDLEQETKQLISVTTLLNCKVNAAVRQLRDKVQQCKKEAKHWKARYVKSVHEFRAKSSSLRARLKGQKGYSPKRCIDSSANNKVCLDSRVGYLKSVSSNLNHV